ncbi:4'-phosphopantetheinyl transferase [Enterococcus sp. 7F3_DIV0205]|uniref:4'-phosphopantetheinyl transferase n=1 Tax=Candidatus Enterococcus palustris TaxID=1834189 RepID=A0AAQ3Y878_9ENTE|nr:4'-phosphopantetheinyl transferase superfamily protein [Enterococcus sp. 7F3_DIV0205]OTN83336.1 hypothetical protein A5821_003259 [Enterococcus sp. 7F3_DIV0205]
MLITHLLKLDHSLNSDTWNNWYHSLESERQNKIDNLRFPDDQLRSLTAGVLLQSMLFNYCQLPPDELFFSTSKQGKPFLASHPDIFFNLTHSGEYVCCSVSTAPVGIDIEQMESIDVNGIARFFSIHEQKYIHSRQTKTEQLDAFYSIWTLKEAFSKTVGHGLSLPMDTYHFILNGESISLSTQIKNDYQFYSRIIDNHYKFALSSSILSKNVEKHLTLTELVKTVSL